VVPLVAMLVLATVLPVRRSVDELASEIAPPVVVPVGPVKVKEVAEPVPTLME